MSIILQKGKPKTLQYTSADFPVLDVNWTGSVSFYTAYPGTAIVTFPLALIGNSLQLSLEPEDILNLVDGLYYMVCTVTNESIGYSASFVDYATVVARNAVDSLKTIISMTIAKIDGSPAGKETRELVNTTTGTTIVLGWKGVAVTASHPVADQVTGTIIGTETISTETNAAGYAQLAVIKGQTVTVACPSFGKTVTVDTTGLDSVDLSSYF